MALNNRALFPLLSLVFVTLVAAQEKVPFTSGDVELLKKMQNQAVAWILKGRNTDYGWDLGGTPKNIIAIASTDPAWPSENDLEAKLTLKQLEIELLHGLIRHNQEPITPAKIAYFSIALNAACKDPKNFHGHNLAGSLEKHTSDQDYVGYPESFGFGLSTLVSCLSGSHLHKKTIRHLITILNDGDALDHIDTRSVSTIALECYRRRRKTANFVGPLKSALESLGQLQKEDGSFGNPHATMLALQALGVAEHDNGSWNRSAAIRLLHEWQQPDGSFFGNGFSTSEGLLAVTSLLNGNGVLSLVRGKCIAAPARSEGPLQLSSNSMKVDTLSKAPASTSNVQTTTGLPSATTNETTTAGNNNPSSMATIRYWLWIGPDPLTAEKHVIQFQVRANSTFFGAMRKAAELDPNYEFSATIWPNGHYVHTINGFREQPIGYHYWLLYKLPSDPDPKAPPPTTFVTPGGADETIVADGDVFMYWYKML